MKNIPSVFSFLIASIFVILIAGCSSENIFIDKSQPMPFTVALPHSAGDIEIQEDDILLKNILVGTWERKELRHTYVKKTNEAPGETTISSNTKKQELVSRKIFSSDGTCSFENDLICSIFSVPGNDNVIKGRWHVADGRLHVVLRVKNPLDGQEEDITLSACVNVTNTKLIYIYWTNKSIAGCLAGLKKNVSAKTTPGKNDTFADELKLEYGIDDCAYLKLVTRTETHTKYTAKDITELHIKTTSPIYKKVSGLR